MGLTGIPKGAILLFIYGLSFLGMFGKHSCLIGIGVIKTIPRPGNPGHFPLGDVITESDFAAVYNTDTNKKQGGTHYETEE